ncbi:ABC transporter permease [Streptomyces sp. CB02923]|uniref:ABC transporter permease n=1 Tax=Streptomyces sp. CB02923 TaxID=1718985 RepID=UPI00093E6C35|nr:ABC transporter permease [Streptomyces sp. CB02923]OKI05471.1 ABC transporter permease [Streptomyces sp. CB02923]
MTAPQTPHDDQPHENRPSEHPYNPWASPSGASSEPTSEGSAVHDRAAFRRELREAALIALAVTVCGALLGVLWAWLAPHVPLIGDGIGNVYLKNIEGEEAIGGDGTFILLALGFGVVCAAVAFLIRRGGGIPLVVALVVGGLLGSVVAWRLGVWLGPSSDLAARAAEAGKGVPFDGPLRLEAKGALLAWPAGAMIAHLLLTGLFGPRDPEPPEPEWFPGTQQTPPPSDG